MSGILELQIHNCALTRIHNSMSINVNNPAGIYLPKVSNSNTRLRCEICSKLTIKTPGVFVVNFEYISHFALLFLLLTLNIEWSPFFYC